MKRTKHQPGFTLLELLFAIILMGVMLSIALVAVIGMLRFYVFSNQVRQNQENGRNMLDTMTREIRFGALLFPKDASPSGNRVCIIDKTNNRLIQYELASPNLVRSTYSYSPASPPTDCTAPGGATIIPPSRNVNLDKMRAVAFEVTKTQGGDTEANTDAAAVLLKLSYITGQPDPADMSKCKIADIYCSNLILNTAVNIRGKEAK